jgi:hypothetical protein
VDLVKAEFTLDAVSLLSKFFKLCNNKEFLINPSVRNLLEALSGQHRGSCFYNIMSDINLPKSLWQVTFGEELYPNIYLEMPQRCPPPYMWQFECL